MAKNCPDCGTECEEVDRSCEHMNYVCPECAPAFVLEALEEHDED